MNVDTENSVYQEAHDVSTEFDADELRRCRLVLRRLRFLEGKARDTERPDSTSAMFVVWEIEALAWMLTELGFLQENTPQESRQA